MGKMKDLTNQRFGKLIVLECVGKLDDRRYSWKCKCDCGNIKIVAGADLSSGNTKTCGCGRANGLKRYNQQQSELAKISIGTKFGKLTVIEDLGFKEQIPGHNRRWYKCQCECGNIHEVMGNSLKSGQTMSCGKCLTSKGEYLILKLLDENHIIYEHDKCLPLFKQEYNKAYRFDFILYNQNHEIQRIIEFDGRQHIKGPDTTYWGHTNDTLDTIRQRDALKNEFCAKHHIPLIRIPYTHINHIILDDLLGNKFLVQKEVINKNERD